MGPKPTESGLEPTGIQLTPGRAYPAGPTISLRSHRTASSANIRDERSSRGVLAPSGAPPRWRRAAGAAPTFQPPSHSVRRAIHRIHRSRQTQGRAPLRPRPLVAEAEGRNWKRTALLPRTRLRLRQAPKPRLPINSDAFLIASQTEKRETRSRSCESEFKLMLLPVHVATDS